MEDLIKKLGKYYLYLEEHFENWEKLVIKTERPLSALRNQSEQLRLVESVDDAEIELLTLPNLRPNLVSKIKCGLEGELSLISNIMEEFSLADAALEQRHAAVVKCSERLRLKPDFIEGSCLCPSLSKLCEWASDTRNYYRVQQMQTTHARKLLDFYNEDSVIAFSTSFQEDQEMKKHVEGIITTAKWFTHPDT